jgi:hypothetical protein
MWYNKAADKSPGIERIQHHLAVLARPNIVLQLFYYLKALISIIPFTNARESINLLFNPFLEDSEIASQRYPLVESALVKAHGTLFKYGTISDYISLMDQFCSILDNYIGRVTAKFRVQGPEIASSLCAATFDFGAEHTFLTTCFRDQSGQIKAKILAGNMEPEDPRAKYAFMHAYWVSLKNTPGTVTASRHYTQESNIGDAKFLDSNNTAAYGC